MTPHRLELAGSARRATGRWSTELRVPSPRKFLFDAADRRPATSESSSSVAHASRRRWGRRWRKKAGTSV